jgi:hypothetical protein
MWREQLLTRDSVSRRSFGDRGSFTIEAILVVPVLMLLVTVLIQCALWAHAEQVVHAAASEGDRVARDYDGGSVAGETRAYSILEGPGSDVSSANVVVNVDPGDMMRVTVTGIALSILPGMKIPVTSLAIGPIQEFRASE